MRLACQLEHLKRGYLLLLVVGRDRFDEGLLTKYPVAYWIIVAPNREPSLANELNFVGVSQEDDWLEDNPEASQRDRQI